MEWLCNTTRHFISIGKLFITPFNWNCHITKLWHLCRYFSCSYHIKLTGDSPTLLLLFLFLMMNFHHSCFESTYLVIFRYPIIIYYLPTFKSTLISSSLTKKKKNHSKMKAPLEIQFFTKHAQTIFKFYEILLKANTYR